MSADVAAAFDEVCAFLAAEVEERLFASGGQLYVSVSGETLVDWAVGVDGVGSPVTTDMLFPVYCAGKAGLVAAIAHLIDGGELSLDDQLAHVIHRELSPQLGHTVVGDVLNHTAGLHSLGSPAFAVGSDRMRADWVRGLTVPAGWRVGLDVGYAHAAWDLLGWAVEDLTGLPSREFVRKVVLDPFDAGRDVFIAGMTGADYEEHRGRLGVNVFINGLDASPILVERTRRFRCVDSIGIGSSASARGLGRLYEGLLSAYRGRSDQIVPAETIRAMTSLVSHGNDVVMGRTCGYGYGLMAQLPDHLFGQLCSPAAFGQSGFGGVSAGFCDPEFDLVVAFHFNGIVDADSALGYRRPALVERIYRAALGLGAS